MTNSLDLPPILITFLEDHPDAEQNEILQLVADVLMRPKDEDPESLIRFLRRSYAALIKERQKMRKPRDLAGTTFPEPISPDPTPDTDENVFGPRIDPLPRDQIIMLKKSLPPMEYESLYRLASPEYKPRFDVGIGNRGKRILLRRAMVRKSWLTPGDETN